MEIWLHSIFLPFSDSFSSTFSFSVSIFFFSFLYVLFFSFLFSPFFYQRAREREPVQAQRRVIEARLVARSAALAEMKEVSHNNDDDNVTMMIMSSIMNVL